MNIESIDGDRRYKLGLIDLLTKYSTGKLMENELKSKLARVDQMEISAIDQDRYQKRFIDFMKENI